MKRNPSDVLETFNFLENADDSDEEEENDIIEDITEGKKKHRKNKKHKIGNEGLAADLTDDPDTEEALKEFDFLVTAEDGEGAGEARSSGDGTEWGSDSIFARREKGSRKLEERFSKKNKNVRICIKTRKGKIS
uniref:Uncharacterized protein n=1 Tax=Micrurus carvalhoi TaxID=3147026 RepID=A0A2H6MZ17_9SAUR